MAEIVVNLVVDKLIPLLKEEAKLLAGVHDQVSSITRELRLMRTYLRDADAKAETAKTSDLAKEWVTQMRQVSIRIQDVLDLHLYKAANNDNKRRQRRNTIVGVLCKICDLLKTVVPRHDISSQIGKIKESIMELKQARETYEFGDSASESSNRAESNSQLHHLRLRANFSDDDQLVGVELTKRQLNSWLSEKGGRTVIAVVGEGGLEGFIEDRENQGQTLKEVAEEYLAELISRSLVKVANMYYYGRVRSCRVHDLMHEFILRKSEELNFYQVKKDEGFRLNEWTRRLSVDADIDLMRTSTSNTRFNSKQYSLLRSFFVFNIKDMPSILVKSLFSSFKLLVTLDCEGAPLDHFPEAFGNLFHLKYMNLRGTPIRTIPKFIQKLQHLESLNLKGTKVIDFPVEINSLVKLRYLQTRRNYHKGVKVKRGIGNLTALHTLSMIDASDEGGDIIEELKNLKQIRTLRVGSLLRENGKLLCSAIESMSYLCSLMISAEKTQVLDLGSLTDPPLNLERLYLTGHLQELPKWVPKLKNLIRLALKGSSLTQDSLPLLAPLPELLELAFYDGSYEGDGLHFREEWFKKLKTLVVRGMPNLKTFRIDEGALPHLQTFVLSPRPQLMTVPDHIKKAATDYWLSPKYASSTCSIL